MSSWSSEATSSKAEEPSPPPCAGCKHLRRRCVPSCAFAAYFPPEHGDQFAAVHKVFGASNVSKLLAEVAPAERAGAVESLVYEATARLRDPAFGCVSYITVLEHMLKQGVGDVAAARGQLAAHVGVGEAFRPFDARNASQEARRAGGARLDAALRFAKEQDDKMRAVRVAVEAKRKQDKRGQGQPLLSRQMAEAQQAAAAAQSAREQATKMQQAAAAAQQHGHRAVTEQGIPDGNPRQQTSAATQQQRHPVVAQHGTGLVFPDGRVHGGHPRQQSADAQKLAGADQVAVKQHLQMLQTHRHPAEQYHQAMALNATPEHEQPRHQNQETAKVEVPAAASWEQQEMKMRAMREDELYYHPNSSQLQMVHAQQRAAAGDVAWEQEMMLRQAAAASVELTGSHNMLSMMQQDAAVELSRDQNVMTMLQQAVGGHGGHQQTVQQQLSAAAGLVVREKQDLMMVQQQAAMNLAAFQPGDPLDAEAFLGQRQPLLQPLLAELPRQQENDGADDDGQLSDVTAYFGIPGPSLPPDGRGSS